MEDEAKAASVQITVLTDTLIDEMLSQLPFKVRNRVRKCLREFLSGICSLEIIYVPGAFVGLTIGKGGSFVEKVLQTTGCVFQIGFNEISDSAYRPAYLFGTENSINEAVKLLHDHFKSQKQVKCKIHGINCNYYETSLRIPNKYLSILRGEDDATLRYLQLRTQTNLCLREDKVNGELTHHLITFGEPTSVDRAQKFIFDWLIKAEKKAAKRTKERQNPSGNQSDALRKSAVDNAMKVGVSKCENGNAYVEEWLAGLSNVERDYESYERQICLLQNKEIDLKEKILQLEKRLQKFQIQKQTLTDDFMKVEETFKQEQKNMKFDYEDKILLLKQSQDTLIRDIFEAKDTRQIPVAASNRFDVEKMDILTCRYDMIIQELINSKEKQATEFTENGTLQNLINSYTKHIADWITAFASEVNMYDLKQNESTEVLFVSVLQKFEELGEKQKGFVVIGIAVLGSVIGMTSPRFLLWAWSRLLEFASRIAKKNPIIVNVWVESLVNTKGYKEMIETWNSGKSIVKEDILLLGIDKLRFAFVHFAPSLFSDDILILPIN